MAKLQKVDQTTKHKYLRMIVIPEKRMNRTVFKLYLELPSSLRVEFIRKETDAYGPIKQKVKENPGNEAAKLEEKRDRLKHLVDKEKDKKFTSLFRFRIYQAEDEESNIGYTENLRFYLPRANHDVNVLFFPESEAVLKILQSNALLFKDLEEFLMME